MSRDPAWPLYRMNEIVGQLPPSARSKVRSITAAIDDLYALITAASERRKSLQAIEGNIDFMLARLDPEDSEGRRHLNEEAEHARAELAKADAETSKRFALKNNLEQTKSQLEVWLGQWAGNGGPVQAATVESPLQEGETASAALVRIRDEISKNDSETARTKSAPPSKEEIYQTLADEVQRKLTAGTPRVIVDAGKVRIEWPDESRFVQFAPTGSASDLWCWLNPGEVYKQLTSGLDGIDGLSKPERQKKLRELEAAKAQLELQEECAVVQAMAEGAEVFRRSSASAMAILQLMPRPPQIREVTEAAE